jgi:hypothetical protein
MKKEDYLRRIKETVDRLSELSEKDRAIIQPQSSAPVIIDIRELFAYGERYEERQRLHKELVALASEEVE